MLTRRALLSFLAGTFSFYWPNRFFPIECQSAKSMARNSLSHLLTLCMRRISIGNLRWMDQTLRCTYGFKIFFQTFYVSYLKTQSHKIEINLSLFFNMPVCRWDPQRATPSEYMHTYTFWPSQLVTLWHLFPREPLSNDCFYFLFPPLARHAILCHRHREIWSKSQFGRL